MSQYKQMRPACYNVGGSAMFETSGMSRIYATFLQYYATRSKLDLWIGKNGFVLS